MDYRRGDRLLVQGFAGDRAVLRVWDVSRGGVLLCTENGYRMLRLGREAALVGFPFADIVGPATG